jgi:Secretion system C-terminal sorting domain
MSLNGGLGDVVAGEKEILFFSDTLTNTGVQAVKHGNGRDWWLLCHKYGGNTYCRFLITSEGITGPYFQNIGMNYIRSNAYGYFSNIKISHDGTQLIKNNSDSTAFELYDLNRCSGELSNRRQVQVSDTLYRLTGVSFSPSGRYAYISANIWRYLFQFDLQSKNIDSSKILLAAWDGTFHIGPTNFYDQALGPDNKIYICNYSYNNTLHVINDPDSPGLKCNFGYNQFQLDSGSYWGTGFPNLPNYELGPLSGSNCDTLITSNLSVTQIAFSHTVYPNPCTDKFQLSITGIITKTEVIIYNEMGEVITQSTLQPVNGFIHGFFNLQNESVGVYLLNAHTDRGNITEKILKE